MKSEKVLAAKLLAYRQGRGLTQAEFAGQAGLSIRALGKVERCEVSTTLKTVDMIAAAMGITAAELLNEQED